MNVSIRVMSQVWEHSRLGGTELLCMLAIADFANDAGTAYPAVETLATKMRMSKRNTNYILRKIEQSGELVIDRNAGPKGCNLFRVQTLQGANLAGVKPVAQGGEAGFPKGVKPIAPEPSLNRQEPSIGSELGKVDQQTKPKKPRTKRSDETLQAFLDRCHAESVKPVPATDPIFEYADKVGIAGLVPLAWFVFKAKHLPTDKKQKDWPAHFRGAVRGNWLKLWYIGDGDSAALTTAGKQAMREMTAHRGAA